MKRVGFLMEKMMTEENFILAERLLAYLGILKWCNSFRFREERVYPYISVRLCKRLVSEKTKGSEARAA